MIAIEKASEIKKLVDDNSKFVILVHRNPDGDALGSSLALMHFLRSIGKVADVIVPNAFPDFLRWLPASDAIVNYEQNKEKAAELLRLSDVIFCLDFNALSRIGEVAGVVAELSQPRVLIDHHLHPEDGFTVAVSNTSACSTAELVYNLLDYLNNGTLLSRDIAECLYTGIMTDTGNFAYASNRKEIYLVVARLIEAGIDKDVIYRKVFYNYSIDRLRLFGYVMNNKLSYYPKYNATLMTLTYNEMRRFKSQAVQALHLRLPRHRSLKSPRHRTHLTLLQQKRVYSISQTPRVLHHRLSVQQLRPVPHRGQALRQASTLSQTAT